MLSIEEIYSVDFVFSLLQTVTHINFEIGELMNEELQDFCHTQMEEVCAKCHKSSKMLSSVPLFNME